LVHQIRIRFEKMNESETTFRRVGIELLGGTMGGVMQALVGHPLDLIKVRMQASASNSSKSMLSIGRHALTQKGGLFKGLSSPLAGAGLLNATMFSVNAQMRRLVRPRTLPGGQALPMHCVVAAAVMTAPFYCAVLTPVELLKCKMQNDVPGGRYSGGVFASARAVVAQSGVAGLFRGYWVTVSTRVVGSPAYFVTYDLMKRWLRVGERRDGGDDDDRLSWFGDSSRMLASGGVAGTAFFAACFPLDTIKSRVQTSKMSVRDAIFSGGLRSLYRGMLPCLLRAPLANGVAFFGFERTIAALQ
jgi:solute carrier family 25 (mitochondrial carnitine/acylcarnitine transporter), member 20/29